MRSNYVGVKLGKHGIEEYQIVVKKRTECTLYAATELVSYVFKATGKSLAIVFERAKNPQSLSTAGATLTTAFKCISTGEIYSSRGKTSEAHCTRSMNY